MLHIEPGTKSKWLCHVGKHCPVSVRAVPEAQGLEGSRYTPQLLKERALSPPNARWALLRRGAEMSFRFGALFSALAWDKVTGQSNLPSRVRLRAAQLRWLSASAWLSAVTGELRLPACEVGADSSLWHQSLLKAHKWQLSDATRSWTAAPAKVLPVVTFIILAVLCYAARAHCQS